MPPIPAGDLVFAFVLPGLIALAGWLAAWRPWVRVQPAIQPPGEPPIPTPIQTAIQTPGEPPIPTPLQMPIQMPIDGRWAGAPVAAIGFAAAYVWLVGTQTPHDQLIKLGDLWVIPAVAILAIVGFVESFAKGAEIRHWRGLAIRGGVLFVFCSALFWLILLPTQASAQAPIPTSLQIVYSCLIAAIATAWWITLERLAETTPGATAPIALWLLSTGSTLVLAMLLTQQRGLAAASLAVIAGVGIVLGFWARRRFSLARGGVAVWVVSLAGMLTYCLFYLYSPPDPLSPNVKGAFAFLAVAPLPIWLAELPGVRKLPGWAKMLIRVIPMAACVATAGYFAHLELGDAA